MVSGTVSIRMPGIQVARSYFKWANDMGVKYTNFLGCIGDSSICPRWPDPWPGN